MKADLYIASIEYYEFLESSAGYHLSTTLCNWQGLWFYPYRFASYLLWLGTRRHCGPYHSKQSQLIVVSLLLQNTDYEISSLDPSCGPCPMEL